MTTIIPTKLNKFQKLYLKNAVKRQKKLKSDDWVFDEAMKLRGKGREQNKVFFVMIRNTKTGDRETGEVIYNIN